MERPARVTSRAAGRGRATQPWLQHISKDNRDSLPHSPAPNWCLGMWLPACFYLIFNISLLGCQVVSKRACIPVIAAFHCCGDKGCEISDFPFLLWNSSVFHRAFPSSWKCKVSWTRGGRCRSTEMGKKKANIDWVYLQIKHLTWDWETKKKAWVLFVGFLLYVRM